MKELDEFKEWFDKNCDLETKEKFDDLKNKYNDSLEENEREEIKKQMRDILAKQYGYYTLKKINENDSPEQKLNNLLSEYINLENPEKNNMDDNVIDWLVYCIYSNIFDYDYEFNLNRKLMNKLRHECLLIKNDQTNKVTKINYPKAFHFIKKFQEKYNVNLDNEIFDKLNLLINDELTNFIESLDKDEDEITLVASKFKIEKYEAEKLINKSKKDKDYKSKVIENLINSEYNPFEYSKSNNNNENDDIIGLIYTKLNGKDKYSAIDKLSDEELDLLFECTLKENNEANMTLLSNYAWGKILERVFERKYNILVDNFDSISILYDILLDIYKEMRQINLQFKKIPLTKEKYDKLQKIFEDDFENICKTLNNINVMQEEIYEVLNPNINSKILKNAWENIVKSKLKTYGKNDEKLEKFNNLLENHLRYSTNIKDTEIYLEEILNNKDILKDIANYDKILSVIEGIIFREKINNEYFIEDVNKSIDAVNEKETQSYLYVHEQYLDRLNKWQKRSPLFRLKKPSKLDIAIEELEKEKKL